MGYYRVYAYFCGKLQRLLSDSDRESKVRVQKYRTMGVLRNSNFLGCRGRDQYLSDLQFGGGLPSPRGVSGSEHRVHHRLHDRRLYAVGRSQSDDTVRAYVYGRVRGFYRRRT